jgi:hypothetical protein
MAQITDARGQCQGGQVGRIDSPKATHEILFPVRLSRFERIGIMNAKSADKEKQQNCITEEWSGNG